MSNSGGLLDDWMRDRARLVEQVRSRLATDRGAQGSQPSIRELRTLAIQLRRMADLVDSGPVLSLELELADLAAFHEESAESFVKGTVHRLWALAEAAESAAQAFPEPRKRPALPEAALTYLHLRQQHGFPWPAKSNNSPDVMELQALLAEAGAPRDATTIRNLLAGAMRAFDPHLWPALLEDIKAG